MTRDQMDRLQPGDVVWSKTRPPIRLIVDRQAKPSEARHGVHVTAPTGQFFITILRAHSFVLECPQRSLEV